MIHTPPQHNTEHPPGQIVHRVVVPLSEAKTLADQIARHEQHEPKKLTFDEWYGSFKFGIAKDLARIIWKEAQANK